ncbi:hypothetical protein HanXRQr2_Chr01g0008451 [Helianthus annuus]|uniref:Uncharacterized protein n=1 Tax=Helianthus annuus TaxID=4232 RepID=A0A9K3P226_HELAN|nr:hypothetical protein HanXRQr2_Chr01g0008451 [Helianthus annuus]
MAQGFLELLIKTVGNAEALDIIDKFQQVIMFSGIIKGYQYLFPHFFFQTLDCLLYCSLLFLLKLMAANQREGEIPFFYLTYICLVFKYVLLLFYTKESLNFRSYIPIPLLVIIFDCKHTESCNIFFLFHN